MRPPYHIHRRLLSHRARGFGHPEGSLPAVEKAIAVGARYIEVDTRVTSDGTVVVYHDAFLESYTDANGPVSSHVWRADRRPSFSDGAKTKMATLEEVVRLFRRRASRDQQLLVDLKDYGHEAEHCEILAAADLVAQAWIVSWYPEALKRVHALLPNLRLSFSHVAMTGRFGPIRHIRRGLPFLQAPLLKLYQRVNRANPNLSKLEVFVDDYDSPAPATPERSSFPIHLLSHVPRGDLGDALRASKGSIGVPSLSLSRDLVRAARAEGLLSFTFSLDSAEQVCKAVQSTDVDVVFTNNGLLFSEGWEGVDCRSS